MKTKILVTVLSLFAGTLSILANSATSMNSPPEPKAMAAPQAASKIVWKHCADEGDICAVEGTWPVRYGAEDAWKTSEIRGRVACVNAVFGDPIFGTKKTCQVPTRVTIRPDVTPVPTATASPTPPSGPTPVANGWSNPATWGGKVPRAGANVTIPAGKVVLLDQDVTVGNLIVDGTLRCRRSKNLSLSAANIMVHGLFRCGTEARPYTKKLTITLRGNPNAPDMMNMGSKVLGVMDGGVLSLHGEQDRDSWVRLNATANKGTRQLTLEGTVNWRAGDTIVITSSSEDHEQAELKTVREVNGRIVTLDSPLLHGHFGERQPYDNGKGKSWLVETRAEVALLSRNIKIQGDGESARSRFGGHVMVMPQSKAYIDGVSFEDMGQEGILGRYPFHWHFVGDGSGQYIRNSAIHNSFNRCVTIHQTDNTRVENNVCFRHIGHGYFLEDGVEQNNIITGNLGAGSLRPRKGKEILETDVMGSRAASGPATFWISNPKNIVNGNVAAGGDGSGFWYATPDKVLKRYDGTTTRPSRDVYQEFHNNLAHSSPMGYNSCVNGGGVRGWESRNIVIRNFTSYMNTRSGNWPCSATTQKFENMKLVDSGRSSWASAFTAPNRMTIVDSLFVANSKLASLNGGKKGRSAYGHYDQGSFIERSHFVGYTSEDKSSLIGFAGGAGKHSANRVNDITLSPKRFTPYEFHREGHSGVGHMISTLHDDAQGSMTGVPNAVMLPKHRMYGGLQECATRGPNIETQASFFLCDMRVINAQTHGLPRASQTGKFILFRVDADGSELEHEFGIVMNPPMVKIQAVIVPNKSFHFGVEFAKPPVQNYELRIAEGHPDDEFIYEYRNTRIGDKPEGFRKVQSIAALKRASDNVYFSKGRQLMFKAKLSGGSKWNAARTIKIVN